ncbi:MAG: type II toxin-antitoxin system HicA family toxin [Candidatus Paceibacterota bacterium]
MPKLKSLSGKEITSIFNSFGFQTHSQRGSHIKLRCVLSDGTKQTLTIPDQKEISTGTTKAIFR